MGRPKKYPNYNADEINANLISAVVEAYQQPTEDGKPVQLKVLAARFGITPPKVRKILITGGVYTSPVMVKVHELHQEGRSVEEIQKLTGLSRSSVHSYLPYSKTVYKTDAISVNAERIRLFRDRQQAVKQMNRFCSMYREKKSQICLTEEQRNLFWNTIVLFQKYIFYAAEEVQFSYILYEKEVVFDKNYVVSREELEKIFENLVLTKNLPALLKQEIAVDSKRWKYLYPVFHRIGVLNA